MLKPRQPSLSSVSCGSYVRPDCECVSIRGGHAAAGIKLSSVVSDVTGVSATALILPSPVGEVIPGGQGSRVLAAERLVSCVHDPLVELRRGGVTAAAAVPASCGVCVGLAEAHDWAGRAARGTQVPPTSGSW
jgi:hypothetical protein